MELKSLDHIDGILNYYNENPECDPNVYEFIQVCDEVSKDLNPTEYEKFGIIDNVYSDKAKIEDTFNTFKNVFFEKFLNCGIDIDESHPLYQFCFKEANDALMYESNNEDAVELNKMLGGVSFYILQQQRDVRNGLNSSFKYDNYNEMNRILELSNKVVHTDDALTINENRVNIPTTREKLINFIEDNYGIEYQIKTDSKVK